MFWHVYFFRRICQACASLWTCFGMFISSAHLSGMRSSLDMFWHVYFFNCICQVCAALWTCFGMFISPVEPARHVLLLTVFSHLCCQVALTQRWNNLSVTNWKKKESGTWSLEWLHCKLLVSSFNLKCQYMSVYAMVGITRSKVIFVKQQNQHLHRSSISLYFPNLEEFRFITVVAFPKDSKIGFAMMILSWIRDPCAASVPQWWTNSNRQKYVEFCSRDAYIHRERERYIYIYIHMQLYAYICVHCFWLDLFLILSTDWIYHFFDFPGSRWWKTEDYWTNPSPCLVLHQNSLKKPLVSDLPCSVWGYLILEYYRDEI